VPVLEYWYRQSVRGISVSKEKGEQRGDLLTAPPKSPGRELHVLGPRLLWVQYRPQQLVLVKSSGTPVPWLYHLRYFCVPFRGLWKTAALVMGGGSASVSRISFVWFPRVFRDWEWFKCDNLKCRFSLCQVRARDPLATPALLYFSWAMRSRKQGLKGYNSA